MLLDDDVVADGETEAGPFASFVVKNGLNIFSFTSSGISRSRRSSRAIAAELIGGQPVRRTGQHDL